MIERVKERFEIKPKKLIGDTAYGSAKLLGWLVEEQDITPHVPVWDKSAGKAGLYGRTDLHSTLAVNHQHVRLRVPL